jgi:hypothetical protein
MPRDPQRRYRTPGGPCPDCNAPTALVAIRRNDEEEAIRFYGCTRFRQGCRCIVFLNGCVAYSTHSGRRAHYVRCRVCGVNSRDVGQDGLCPVCGINARRDMVRDINATAPATVDVESAINRAGWTGASYSPAPVAIPAPAPVPAPVAIPAEPVLPRMEAIRIAALATATLDPTSDHADWDLIVAEQNNNIPRFADMFPRRAE